MQDYLEFLALVAGASGADIDKVNAVARSLSGGGEMASEAQLRDLFTNRSVPEFQEAGLSEVEAKQLCAAFQLGRRTFVHVPLDDTVQLESSSEAYAFLKSKLSFLDEEHFAIVAVDQRLRVKAYKILCAGNRNLCHVPIKETMQWLLRIGAEQFLVAHNHPSNSAAPSKDDIQITKDLIEIGEIAGIPLIDHFVIGRNVCTTIRADYGYLWSDDE